MRQQEHLIQTSLSNMKRKKYKKNQNLRRVERKPALFLQGGASWVVGSFGVPEGMHLQLQTLRQSDNDAGTRHYRLGTVTLMCLH